MIGYPWPPKELNPNARVHWRKKAKHAGQYRLACYLITRQAGVRPMLNADAGTRYQVALRFCPPTRTRRDMDNCLSACKQLLDALAQAMGVDDSQFSLQLEFGPVVKGGAVQIEVTS